MIRLHGGDRKEMEEQTGNNWSKVVVPTDGDLQSLAKMLADLKVKNIENLSLCEQSFRGVGTEDDYQDK